ncbi:MAG: ABC transporter [Myxococcales bacterium]|nr:ABC transporter [Myxococcales bacterium]
MTVRKQQSAARQAVTHAGLVMFTLMVLYPVFWVIAMAFTPQQGFSMSLLPLPTNPTFDNFIHVVSTEGSDGSWLFGRQLFNSLVISLSTTIVGIFMACTAAYAFSRFSFPGRRAGLMMFLVSQMFPGTLMLIPLYVILDALGLLNQVLGLILVYSTTSIPFCVWMLKGYFDTIPRDLEESAIIDGASPFTTFWRIILPLARPAIAVTALFSFMTAWNEFILATTFMSTETSYTLPVTLRNYVGEYSTYWGYFAAGAILVSIPVMALFFLLQKNLVGGLTAGAVKG